MLGEIHFHQSVFIDFEEYSVLDSWLPDRVSVALSKHDAHNDNFLL